MSFQSSVSNRWSSDAEKSATDGFRFLLVLSIFGISFNMIGGVLFARYLSNSLMAINRRLHREATDVTTAAEGIADTSDQISGGATEQAASLEETAASMNEITAMVANSASSANKSRQVAVESQKVAAEGKQVMEQLLVAIHEIDTSNDSIMNEVAQSNRQIGEIVTIIETIRDKTKVINDIVFQTKLLSFNASVEAARAGRPRQGICRGGRGSG